MCSIDKAQAFYYIPQPYVDEEAASEFYGHIYFRSKLVRIHNFLNESEKYFPNYNNYQKIIEKKNLIQIRDSDGSETNNLFNYYFQKLFFVKTVYRVRQLHRKSRDPNNKRRKSTQGPY